MATYRVLIDWDRDEFFHRGTASTDALNLIPSPVDYKGLDYAAAIPSTAVTLERLATAYGIYTLRANMAAVAGAGVYLGANSAGTINDIPVTAGNTYTAAVWVKTSTVSNTNITLNVHTQAGVLVAASSATAVTGSWTQITAAFIAPVGCTHVRLSAMKATTISVLDLYTAGWMLVAGSSAPSAFNSGSALHYRENVADYVTALQFTDGMSAAYQGLANPARMTVQLLNRDGEWLPENTGSPFYGMLAKNTLVCIEAEHSGTLYPLWQGTIKQISVSPFADDPYVALTIEDATLLLLDKAYTPPLLQDVTTGEALTALFDSTVITYPYPGAFNVLDAVGYAELDSNLRLFENRLIDFDDGKTTLAYVGDNVAGDAAGVGAQAYIADVVAAELGGRFAFDGRTGQFVFHDRHRDILYDGSVTTFTRDDLVDAAYVWGDDVVNDLTIGYMPRRVGSAGSVLYTLPEVPSRIQAGKARTFSAAYRTGDAANSVGGIDMIYPVAGVDYIAYAEDTNVSADASGNRVGSTDVTNSVIVHVEFGAQSARIAIQNNAATAVYITFLQLRGTPLIADTRQAARSVAPKSIGDQGLHLATIELNAVSDGALVQAYADYLINRYSTPIGRFASITIPAHKSDTLRAAALALGFGDFVTVTDDYLTNAQTDYVVIGREHSFDIAGDQHLARLTLQPVNRQTWLILYDSDAELDTAIIAL